MKDALTSRIAEPSEDEADEAGQQLRDARGECVFH